MRVSGKDVTASVSIAIREPEGPAACAGTDATVMAAQTANAAMVPVRHRAPPVEDIRGARY